MIKRWFCCAVLLFGSLGPLRFRMLAQDADVGARVQALVRAHQAWEQKISSPGASMRAKEIGRRGSAVDYLLYVSGLPKDRLYSVQMWPVNRSGPYEAMAGVSLGEDGMVMCTGRMPGECADSSDKTDKDYGQAAFTFDSLPGEPNRVALVNGEERVAIVIVPNPIVGRDRNCTISVVRLTPRFEVAYLTGSGFTPGSKVLVRGDSYGEKHVNPTVADADGNIRFAIVPFVAGHEKGTTQVTVSGPNCSPSLHFDWGQ